MRFIENGPELPDELLTARDAGQVLFFCGAGVSLAEAGLPTFDELAGSVLDSLGAAIDSPARRLFDSSSQFKKLTGLTGGVATDRIFSLLEQEFYPEEVRQAVAAALVPPEGHSLGAHRVLLDLSRDAAGVARLITTNFDRLFEDCDPELGSFNPPNLPDPRRPKDFRGIIHIHGRVDANYKQACDDEFVLSSADFGRAYLADGWATRYIQMLLQRFKIIFVGYSAEDPPVQYLLEALNRSEEPRNDLYAFQSGSIEQAAAQWRHKGVQPIPYDSANQHAALWETLRAWAARARDAEAWHDHVIAMAAAGPAALRPHERGIVAHIAATRDGARRLSRKGTTLPAEWLSVFDPKRRYASPGRHPYEDTSERVDPFDALGLDSDRPPLPADPDDNFSRRDVPDDALDLFASMDSDRERLPDQATAHLRGREAGVPSQLPARLWHLGTYLVHIAHEPAAIWWAAHQSNLHPEIVRRIEWSMRQEADRFPSEVRKAWRMLIAAWCEDRTDPNNLRYELENIVSQSGWSSEAVRATINMYKPILVAQPPIDPRLPPSQDTTSIERIVRLDVEYPRPHEPLPIPPEHLSYALSLLRGHIEHAIVLERETGGHDRVYFDTTRPEDGAQPDENAFQMTGLLGTFINMMTRLAQHNPIAARAEFERWPSNANQVFNRLRIWATSQSLILTPEEAGPVFLSLDEDTFWNSQQERDLLHALRDRWTELSQADRLLLEQRLLTGSFPWREPRDDLEKVNAHYRLNRLQWLNNQGVTFSFDLETEMKSLRQVATEWEAKFADSTAQPQVGKVRTIQTDTDPSQIQSLPISRVLAAARDAAGRDFESFVDHRPFFGLAEQRPAFALAVLTDAARKGEFPEREWAALLHATSKGVLKRRMQNAIAARLAQLAPEHVVKLRYPLSTWINDRAGSLIVENPAAFDTVWSVLATALANHPPEERSRRTDKDWVSDGLNQPAGRLADALFKGPAIEGLQTGNGLPNELKQRLEQLLGLPGDTRRHAISMISPRFNWLYLIDPDWAGGRLLAVALGEGPDTQAFWGGYFWAARTPQAPLYEKLKPAFLALARTNTNQRDCAQKLAGILLAGWGHRSDPPSETALITDAELREVLIHSNDDLRTQTLWHLEQWAKEPNSKWNAMIVPFFTNVWPRQRAVRTPKTSVRLVEFVLGMLDRLEGIADLILPLISPVEGRGLRVGPFMDIEQGIAARHPLSVLNLLWKVLPEDPWLWPYGTEHILNALTGQDELVADQRLAELIRREKYR